MWKTVKEMKPVVISANEVPAEVFGYMCGWYGLDPFVTDSIVIREDSSVEYSERENSSVA